MDGASRGNPGPAGVGAILTDEEGFYQEHLEYIGEATNNVAEYRALLLALRKARLLHPRAVRIFSDSELLVKQLRGEYRVRNPRLLQLYRKARAFLSSFSSFQIEHVKREQNWRADELANLAIDRALAGRG